MQTKRKLLTYLVIVGTSHYSLLAQMEQLVESRNPLPNGTITITFLCDGDGNNCNGLYSEYIGNYIHTGLDSFVNYLGESPNNRIFTTLPGTVATNPVSNINCFYCPGRVGSNSGCTNLGNHVVIKHLLTDGNVRYSMYGHLLRMDNNAQAGRLVQGQRVSSRQFVGHMGKTGTSCGAHLHFEISKQTQYSSIGACRSHWIPSCNNGARVDPPTGSTVVQDPMPFTQGEKRVLVPKLSNSVSNPGYGDYDVYGFVNHSIYASISVTPDRDTIFYNVGVGGRRSDDPDTPEDLFINASEAAFEGQEMILTGSNVFDHAGDYLFFAYIEEDEDEQKIGGGFPVKFTILPNQESKIVDNDSRAGFAWPGMVDGISQASGYFMTSLLFKGDSNGWAQWRPEIVGDFEIWAHVPEHANAEGVVYKIYDGQSVDPVLTDPVNHQSITSGLNNEGWVQLTANSSGRTEWHLTSDGYVGLSLDGSNPNVMQDQFVGIDAIKFIKIEAKVGKFRNRSSIYTPLFIETYNYFGGWESLGLPHDDQGSEFIHWLSNRKLNFKSGVWLQNLYKGMQPKFGDGHTSLILNLRLKKVFLIRSDIRNYYASNHGYLNLGAPRTNDFEFGGLTYQFFEKGYLVWDGIRVLHYLPNRTLIAEMQVSITSINPGVKIMNNNVLIGQTPFSFSGCDQCGYEMEVLTSSKMKRATPDNFSFVIDPQNPTIQIEANPTPDTITIGGAVTRPDGYPIWDVVLSGLGGNPQTDNHGAFSVEIPRGSSVTITPSKQYYTFAEPPLEITNAQADITDISFTGTKIQPSIPFRVTHNGTGLEGVRLSGLSGNAITDSNGEYLADLHVGWEGTIRPRLRGFRFTPTSQPVPYLEEDMAPVQFTATERTATISGRILLHDQPLAGVVMQGLPGNPLTDVDGRYSATVSYAWSGLVTPVSPGYAFYPPNRDFQELISSRFDKDYLALPRGYTISGIVTEGGAGLPDAWLTGLPAGVISDSSGNYAALVNHGWSETVTPLKLGYQFNPANITLPPVTANQNDVDFSGSLLPGERRIWTVTNVPEFDQATVFADPGDIIYVKPGVYDEPRLRSLHDGVTLISEAGAEQTIINIDYYNLNEDNTTFDGFTFQGQTTQEMLQLNNVSNILIRNCIFNPISGEYAIRINESENVIIEGNIIGDAASRGILIRVGNSGGAITIRNNVFPQTQRAIDGGNNLSFSITAYNNLFDGNQRVVDLYDIHSFIFYNNIVVNNTTKGVDLGELTTTAQIYQNTFVGNESATQIGNHALMYNNLFKDNNRNIDGAGNPNINIHHTFHWPGNLLYCCANFIVDLGTTLQLDPQFVDQANGDYHLSQSSPAIEAGSNGYDLGAYGGPNGNSWPTTPGQPQVLPALSDFQINGPLETGTGRTVPMQAKAFYAPNYFSWVQHLVSWSSSNSAVLEHQGQGRFLAHSPGTVVVTGVFEGVSRNFTVQVLDATLDAAMESVQQTASSKVAGDPQLMLFINYANNGLGGAANVLFSADYDPAFTFLSAVPAADAGANNAWTLPDLQPGESGSIAITGSIPATLGNDAELISNVQVSADFNNQIQVQEITQIPGVPELAVQVSANGPVVPGDSVVVTVTLSNNGTATAQNGVLHAAYDGLIRFLAASPPPTSETNDWEIGFLEAGGQVHIDLELEIDPFLGPDITLENLFTLSADYVADAQVLYQPITSAPVADLDVVQFTGRDYALPAVPLTWWLLVTNRGPSSASNLMLTNTLSQGVEVLDVSHPFTVNSDDLEMALGNLGPDESLTVLVTVSPPAEATLDALANLSAAETDPDLTNNMALGNVPIAYPPEATIDTPASSLTIITGDSVSFSGSGFDPDGQNPLSYLWDFDGAAPADTSEDPGEVVFSTLGTYTITFGVTDDLGIADPTPATRTVTVNDNQSPLGLIDTPHQNAAICQGDTLHFTGTATDPDGHEPIDYLWDFDGVVPNSDLEDPGAVVFNQLGTFVITLQVTDARGLADPTPASIEVIVRDPVTITDQPAPAAPCEGQPVTFSVAATGSGPLTFQWRKDGVEIPGATAGELSIPTPASDDAGIYDCQVGNACGDLLSQSALLTINETMAITNQPAPANACIGDRVTLTVAASGSAPISYQWRKSGVDLAGETGANLVMDPVSSADAGNYHCLLTNACGSLTSSTALLEVSQAPSIGLAPVSQNVCAGDPATFSVTAQGTGPFSYQWLKDGLPIPNAVNPSLTINQTTSSDAAAYACQVSNSCGSVSSPGGQLTVVAPVALSLQPVGTTACTGDSVTFEVAASGTGPITYQWHKDGLPIAGAVNASLVLGSVETMDDGTYTCTVSNSCASVVSGQAILVIHEALSVDTSPQNAEVCLADAHELTVVARGGGSLTYEWRKDGVAIPGAVSTSLTFNSVEPADQGVYACAISNPCGTLLTDEATLVVNQPVRVDTQPQSPQPCLGDTVTLSLSASGSGPLSYQWLKDGVGIPSAISASLNLSDISAGNAGNYVCRVTNMCGSVFSTPVALTVAEGPAIEIPLENLLACPGDSVLLSVQASGAEPLYYQWRLNGIDLGINEPEIVVFATESLFYECAVSNACGTVLAQQAELVVMERVAIDSQPQSTVACPQETATFSLLASGSQPLTYQWRRDGMPISGQTGPELTIPMVTLADAGLYDCVITNDCGPEISQAATLTVENDLQVAVLPRGNVQGLDPLSLEALIFCAAPGYTWEWRDLNTGLTFGLNQSPISLPLLNETTAFEVEASDGVSLATDEVLVLVAENPAYADLNGDGCNSLADLFLLLVDWRQPLTGDPNGDGFVDIRDFLYINLDDPEPCVP